MFKKKIIITILIIIILLAAGFLVLKRTKKGPDYSTFTVTRGNLKQTVEATGKVKSAEKIELNFKTTGRLAHILPKVGDEVKAGQTLAILENKALQSQVDEAKARCNQARADYEKLLAGASFEEIKIAEDTVAQKEQDLTSAKNNLINLKAKHDIELLNLKEAALTSLNNEIIVAQGALDEIDNTLNDPDSQDTLSVKDSGALVRANKSQESANEAVKRSESQIKLINLQSSDDEVLTALDDLADTLNQVTTALSDTLNVLVATLTSSDLSETELDTLKTNIKNQQTKNNTAKTNVQVAKANWTNKITYYQDQVGAGEDAVIQSEKSLDLAKSQLALKKSAARDFEIKAAQAQIEASQAALNLAIANLTETIITAPLAGLIIQKNYQVGEQTSLAKPVLIMISHSSLQIEVDTPEFDITKVKLGQQVEITLDAFGNEKKFTGKVIFIDPAETIIQDVVYYQVKVQFDEEWNEVKPGMSVNMTICTNQKENVLFVPSRAVKSHNGEKYVEVLANGLVKEKTVTTGLGANEGTEIVSGLREGDEVVTFVKDLR